MTNTPSLQQAAQTLLTQFGARLETGRDEGRKRMAEALSIRLGLSEHDARTLVDDLIRAHTVRWIDRPAANRTNRDTPPVVAGATAQQTEYVFGAAFTEGGYWQLSDEGAPT